ncbi:MAG: hypothetical protein DHS20C05_17460 [Hyphococcus sp.]|nr:MAG: hypothetical protein DHS20C05_17460 [Marinicaulis sp.]
MVKKTTDQGVITAMRASLTGALRHLAGKAPEPKAPSQEAAFAPYDPTIGLYGADEQNDEPRGALPLSTQLEESARAMVSRAEQLKADADRLVWRIGERADGEITMAAQALRVLIGIVWLGVAAWLYNAGLSAKAADMAVTAGGMPVDDAFVLSRTFLIIAAAGLGVAFFVGAIVQAVGKAGNDKIRREAEQLGMNIAETSRDFDNALTGFRANMDKRNNPADAVDDLSRAYLTALEAQAYFREISFLTGMEGREASHLFRGFLHRPSVPPPAGPVFILGGMLGVFSGALFVYKTMVPRPEVVEPVAPLAIAQYPWALNLLFFGGVAFAAAGIVLSLFSGLFISGAIAKAREEALDALRGGFTAREAPRPADVVRRIEDAVDVFRARVGRSGGSRNLAASSQKQSDYSSGASGSYSGGDDEIPAWRRRDSSAKFVDTGFQAAPGEWRTDAFEKKLSGEPEAKRGLFKLKKGPSD